MSELEDIYRHLVQIHAVLDKLQANTQALLDLNSAPSLGLRVVKFSDTVPGAQGQVTPGTYIKTGEEASVAFRELGQATVIPLSDLPPWTHMALAQGQWWLVQMA